MCVIAEGYEHCHISDGDMFVVDRDNSVSTHQEYVYKG